MALQKKAVSELTQIYYSFRRSSCAGGEMKVASGLFEQPFCFGEVLAAQYKRTHSRTGKGRGGVAHTFDPAGRAPSLKPTYVSTVTACLKKTTALERVEARRSSPEEWESKL